MRGAPRRRRGPARIRQVSGRAMGDGAARSRCRAGCSVSSIGLLADWDQWACHAVAGAGVKGHASGRLPIQCWWSWLHRHARRGKRAEEWLHGAVHVTPRVAQGGSAGGQRGARHGRLQLQRRVHVGRRRGGSGGVGAAGQVRLHGCLPHLGCDHRQHDAVHRAPVLPVQLQGACARGGWKRRAGVVVRSLFICPHAAPYLPAAPSTCGRQGGRTHCRAPAPPWPPRWSPTQRCGVELGGWEPLAHHEGPNS
jgi:hypothetical protein